MIELKFLRIATVFEKKLGSFFDVERHKQKNYFRPLYFTKLVDPIRHFPAVLATYLYDLLSRFFL